MPEETWIPVGARTAAVQKVTDGCALLLPELTEGRSLSVLLLLENGAVTVMVRNTTLPVLRAPMRQRDRFRTDERQVGITAKGGSCSSKRRQWYEGRDETQTDYRIIFRSDDEAGVGDCGGTPLPCKTEAQLSIRWCPPGVECNPILR